MNNQLNLQFLGAPQVSFQGKALKFRSRKVLALLIYLIVTREFHNRETLMVLLWPNSDRHHAQTSLRTTIAQLRKSLQDAGDFLVVENDMVKFNFELSYWLDLHEVENALQASNPDAWQAALRNSRGEFLAGFSVVNASNFDDWITLQRLVR